jgi:hypothetical protein
MDSARQALRWSIPGLVFVLELGAFGAIWQLVNGGNPANMVDRIGPTTALATLLAGVPIGFLLYQLYYRNYRPYGWSFLLLLGFLLKLRRGWSTAWAYWRFVRRDRGAEILRHYFAMGGHPNLIKRSWGKKPLLTGADDERISEVTKLEALVGGDRPSASKVLRLRTALHENCVATEPIVCRECRKAYTTRFRWSWAVIMAMLDYSSSRPEGAAIKAEYAAGSDIYHALGAARTAIASAAVGSIGYRFVFHVVLGPDGGLVGFLIAAALVVVLAYAQYQVIHSAREQSSTNLTIRTAAALAWFSRLPEERKGWAATNGSAAATIEVNGSR